MKILWAVKKAATLFGWTILVCFAFYQLSSTPQSPRPGQEFEAPTGRHGFRVPEIDVSIGLPLEKHQNYTGIRNMTTNTHITLEPLVNIEIPISAGSIWRKWQDSSGLYHTVYSNPRPAKGFLTVGIPSIRRENGNLYLMQTIQSIINSTSDEDKAQTIAVAFISDLDLKYNLQTAEFIQKRFAKHVLSGFLHIVVPSREAYPDLTKLKRNFGDTQDRVQWRAKQALDFALLFAYARNLSQYYVMIEDDVLSAKNFVPAIKNFIKVTDAQVTKKKKVWAMLEFSQLGFIGKLVRSSDLDKFAEHLALYFQEQPVDWLMGTFYKSMGQRDPIRRTPSLFQHHGLVSSFDTRDINRLVDKSFAHDGNLTQPDRPQVTASTTLHGMKPMDLERLYYGHQVITGSSNNGAGHVALVFEEKQEIESIHIVTGFEREGRPGAVTAGSLRISQTIKDRKTCLNPQTIGQFVDGVVKVEPRSQVKCIVIEILAEAGKDIVFRTLDIVFATKNIDALGQS